jgi:hypothetical protein
MNNMEEIKPKYITFEQAKWLKEKGFENIQIDYGLNQMLNNAKPPEQWQVVEWLENFNLYINISTEFYKDGVNFIWQILEYDVNEARYIGKKSSMSYGDNGEYKTRESAYLAAFDYILNNNLI